MEAPGQMISQGKAHSWNFAFRELEALLLRALIWLFPLPQRTGSNLSLAHTVINDRQRKKAAFFARAFSCGRNLVICGIGLIVFWSLVATLGLTAQNRTNFTLGSVFWACRSIFLAYSSHTILRFSSHVYNKNLKETIERRSRTFPQRGGTRGRNRGSRATSYSKLGQTIFRFEYFYKIKYLGRRVYQGFGKQSLATSPLFRSKTC